MTGGSGGKPEEPNVNEVNPGPEPEPEPEPGDPIDGTLAVGPQVADGMIPVKYIDGTGWVKLQQQIQNGTIIVRRSGQI